MQTIAIFASGTGTNARKIMEYFHETPSIQVGLVVSNKSTAGVLNIAAEHGVPTYISDRTSFYETEDLLQELNSKGVDWIILAGFLWLIPAYLLRAYPQHIINIHPALLPKYGGKGMYGMHVHRAVKEHHETESGITIHYVNERYDEGGIIFQAQCPIFPEDTPDTIARKIQHLEHMHYSPVIHRLIESQLT